MNRIQSKQSHCVYQPLVELSLKGVSDISINVDYQKVRRYKIPIICCFIKKKKVLMNYKYIVSQKNIIRYTLYNYTITL